MTYTLKKIINIIGKITSSILEEMMIQQNKIEKIEEFIKTLSQEELQYVNKLVVNRIKMLHQQNTASAMMQFNVNDIVSFTDPESGEKKIAQVERINKKTISVRCTDRTKWNVHPKFLSLENSI